MELNFVLVPWWLERALNRANMTMDILYDYPKLRTHINLDDLAVVARLNLGANFKFGDFPYPQTSILNTTMLLSRWLSCDQAQFKAELGSALPFLSCGQDIVTRLHETLKPEHPSQEADDQSVCFKIVDIGRNSFALVLYPGFDEIHHRRDLHIHLLKSIVEQLYTVNNAVDVNVTKVFHAYIDLLEKTVRDGTRQD